MNELRETKNIRSFSGAPCQLGVFRYTITVSGERPTGVELFRIQVQARVDSSTHYLLLLPVGLEAFGEWDRGIDYTACYPASSLYGNLEAFAQAVLAVFSFANSAIYAIDRQYFFRPLKNKEPT